MLSGLHATLRDSVRMGFLHSSRAAGRLPAALRRAADVRYLGHSAGQGQATALHFELPQFGAVASELFQQGQLWDNGPKPEQTAIDLLAGTLSDVRCNARNSARFDHALLRRLARYRPMFRSGLTAVALVDAQGPTPAQIDAELSQAAQSLYRETPPPRRVRLSAHLDLLGVSKKVLGLFAAPHTPVTAVWNSDDFIDLARFLGRQVLIEGLAEFRPSGTLLRIDADAIREAEPGDSFFRTLPHADPRREYQVEAAPRRAAKPYAAIYGIIPADESDEEFARAVDELS